MHPMHPMHLQFFQTCWLCSLLREFSTFSAPPCRWGLDGKSLLKFLFEEGGSCHSSRRLRRRLKVGKKVFMHDGLRTPVFHGPVTELSIPTEWPTVRKRENRTGYPSQSAALLHVFTAPYVWTLSEMIRQFQISSVLELPQYMDDASVRLCFRCQNMSANHQSKTSMWRRKAVSTCLRLLQMKGSVRVGASKVIAGILFILMYFQPGQSNHRMFGAEHRTQPPPHSKPPSF